MASDPATNRFRMTLEALEQTSHVPYDEQVEELAEPVTPASDPDWDENQRFLRLAGGA